jgi:hypothetical protein
MDPTGITISAMKIEIDGQLKVSVSSVMTEVDASGILTLNGTLTKIN